MYRVITVGERSVWCVWVCACVRVCSPDPGPYPMSAFFLEFPRVKFGVSVSSIQLFARWKIEKHSFRFCSIWHRSNSNESFTHSLRATYFNWSMHFSYALFSCYFAAVSRYVSKVVVTAQQCKNRVDRFPLKWMNSRSTDDFIYIYGFCLFEWMCVCDVSEWVTVHGSGLGVNCNAYWLQTVHNLMWVCMACRRFSHSPRLQRAAVARLWALWEPRTIYTYTPSVDWKEMKFRCVPALYRFHKWKMSTLISAISQYGFFTAPIEQCVRIFRFVQRSLRLHRTQHLARRTRMDELLFVSVFFFGFPFGRRA